MTTLKAYLPQINVYQLTKTASQIAAFTLLTALCAHAKFYLPFTPVPITLQSFAVVLSGALLGSRKGLASQVLLLVAGSMGFSVFSAGTGLAVILGPTGGYLLGFLLSAYVAGKIFESEKNLGFFKTNSYLFLASLFIFLPGVVWLKVFTDASWASAIQMGFVPFIAGDILKTVLASITLRFSNR